MILKPLIVTVVCPFAFLGAYFNQLQQKEEILQLAPDSSINKTAANYIMYCASCHLHRYRIARLYF